MNKHTPAPWSVNHQRQNGVEKYWIVGANKDEIEANEELIAAAPELLEALVYMVDQITNKKNATHTLDAYTHGLGISMAKEAIAKATGK